MKRNVIVGQSGGPTAAINSSLAGVYRTAKDRGANKVYGMLHGIQGLLEEKYIDLADHIKTELDAELLKRTPAAFLGSCRYKLPEIHENREVYEKIFEILDKLDIEAFIYIGGNDSMDTIKKLSDYEFEVDGSVKLDDFNDETGTHIQSEDYDSIGGHIIELLDRIPNEGEQATEHGITYIVLKTEKNRISRVRVHIEQDYDLEEPSSL